MKTLANCLWKKGGFTLIEVLVATIIFLFCVLALSALFLNSYKAISVAGCRSAAVQAVQQEMERAIADPVYEGEEVEREAEYELLIFGRTISGTLITVEKKYNEAPLRKVTFVTFIPEE
jgi:prepilin-type N-terminal cleavage/methylation domain-containing protein